MGRAQTGIHQDKQGFWCVDRIYKGSRLRNRFESFEEAESWLIFQLDQLRQIHLFGIRPRKTFDEAAAKYLLDHQEKVSLSQDIYLLERLVPFIGKLTLDQIHDGTLAPYIKDRKTRGLAHKTINCLSQGLSHRL